MRSWCISPTDTHKSIEIWCRCLFLRSDLGLLCFDSHSTVDTDKLPPFFLFMVPCSFAPSSPSLYQKTLRWPIKQFELNNNKNKKMTTMMMVGLGILDFLVAGVSLMIGLTFFAFITSILCAAAFFNTAKDVSWILNSTTRHYPVCSTSFNFFLFSFFFFLLS